MFQRSIPPGSSGCEVASVGENGTDIKAWAGKRQQLPLARGSDLAASATTVRRES
jgi:hypothetical protein